jgi:hypothetical protein
MFLVQYTWLHRKVLELVSVFDETSEELRISQEFSRMS